MRLKENSKCNSDNLLRIRILASATLQLLITTVRLCLQQDLVPRKMVKFNPGLSPILSKVFLSENM